MALYKTKYNLLNEKSSSAFQCSTAKAWGPLPAIGMDRTSAVVHIAREVEFLATRE